MAILVRGWKCDSCDVIVVDDLEKDALYECPQCGDRYARSQEGTHRCPSCGTFGSKVSDFACQECFQGEMVEEDVYRCSFCDEAFDDESDADAPYGNSHATDRDPDGGANASRDADSTPAAAARD